ncbi:MAG: hypothetical protein V4726_05620 [Verrucomicrobiota bacterium]
MEVLTVIGFAVGATSSVSTATLITAAVQVGAAVGSMAYQKKQQKKAKAAAERMRREQQRQASLTEQKLKKLSKSASGPVGFDSGTFATASGPRDITSMVRRSTASRRIAYGRARLGGIWFYPETTGASNETLHLILGLCEGPVEAIETVYFDDEAVTLDADGNGTGKWAGSVLIKKHLGTPDDPAEPLLTAVSTRWTAAHRLTGIAYLYVRLTVNLELFSAVPEISAVVKGKNNIWDPRTNLRGYSTNPALCLNDYLTTSLVGPGIAQADIDTAALIDAANVCDGSVPTLLGSEPRYSCQGAIDLSSTVEDNASLFIQSMNGDLIQSGGIYAIQAGQFVTPTFTIGLDMLAGPIEFSSLQARRDRANIVKGTFLSETNNWQKFDFPAVTDAAAVAMDGQEVVSDLTLEMVGSGSQAQRLASMELKQARHGRTVQLICNLMAMPARVGSNVILDIPRYFDGAVYRVVESKFSVGNDGAPAISLTLLENSPEIYQWDLANERLINVPADLNAKTPQTSQPVYSPDAGSGPSLPADITITSLTAGAVIRWAISPAPLVTPLQTETDGTAYTGPVTVEAGDFLHARAFRAGYLASPLTIEGY